MKKQTLIIAYAFIMCCLFGQTMTTYTLCEGNFQTPNASLWSINSAGNLDGPIHWDENLNPLGDTGQSLTIHDKKIAAIAEGVAVVGAAETLQGEAPDGDE